MFDKEKFKELVILARGDRTNQQYSDDSGVSRAYISGYINKKIDNAPTPEVIKRLASCALNGITYEDFMKAAGHIKDTLNNQDELVLTAKDNKDVEKLLNKTIELIDNQEGLMLNGELLDDEDLLLLKQAIRNGLEYAKISNKKKYTPKKYRKNNEDD